MAAVFKRFGYQLLMWQQSVCVRLCVCPLSSMCTHAHTHINSAVLSEVQPEVYPTSQSIPMMFVPSKPEQLLRDLAPHPALSRSGTQCLLSCSLIPLWFILVLFAFPECSSACLTVPRSLPSPTLYQWITHPSTGAICRIVCVCVCGCAVLIAQTVMACFSSATVEQAVLLFIRNQDKLWGSAFCLVSMSGFLCATTVKKIQIIHNWRALKPKNAVNLLILTP